MFTCQQSPDTYPSLHAPLARMTKQYAQTKPLNPNQHNREQIFNFLIPTHQGSATTVGGKRTGPDRKTIHRIIQHCIDNNYAYSVDVEVPVGKKWRKVQSRNAEVIVRRGLALDEALLSKVRVVNCLVFKRLICC